MLRLKIRSQEYNGDITCMELLPDGNSLVVGSEFPRPTLWDLTPNRLKCEFLPRSTTLDCRDIAINPDGTVSIGSLVAFFFCCFF